MKHDPSSQSQNRDASDIDLSERFVDAALIQHARLDHQGTDPELVQSILQRTVHQSPRETRPDSLRREDRRIWMVGVASAAAAVAALATLLAVLPFSSAPRQVDEIRLLVHVSPEVSDEDDAASGYASFQKAPPQASPVPFSYPASATGFDFGDYVSEKQLEAPAFHFPHLASDRDELVLQDLVATFSTFPAPSHREEVFEIVADRTTEAGNRRIYDGKVEVAHARFRLTADHVELIYEPSAADSKSVKLVAKNALIVQRSPARKALAEEVHYEPAIDRFSLRGIAYLDSEQGQLNSFEPNDVAFLMGETFVLQKVMGSH